MQLGIENISGYCSLSIFRAVTGWSGKLEEKSEGGLTKTVMNITEEPAEWLQDFYALANKQTTQDGE